MHENEIFITYIECRPSLGENNVILEPILDRNFVKLVSSIEDKFTRVNIELARAKAKCLIILEFFAQVLYLIILSKKFEIITHNYLLAQIDGGQNSITEIKDKLRPYDYNNLEFLFRSALKFLEVTI